MNLKYLDKLKEKLVHADNFATVMDYFMTEFGDHKKFLRKGKHVRNKELEAALCEMGKEVFPDAPAIILSRIAFVEIPGYNFTHGGFLMNGRPSTMFYFSDLQMGLLAVPVSMSGLTKFLRFTAKHPAPNLAPSDN